MCLYKHFTLLERESLQVLLVKGMSIGDIAKELGKDKTEITYGKDGSYILIGRTKGE